MNRQERVTQRRDSKRKRGEGVGVRERVRENLYTFVSIYRSTRMSCKNEQNLGLAKIIRLNVHA